jgi:hypothetical protein
MPYHHPVAITASVIWWGIYLGSLGASLGALAGLVLRRARPSGETKSVAPAPTAEQAVRKAPQETFSGRGPSSSPATA